jgi:hypothetical protein
MTQPKKPNIDRAKVTADCEDSAKKRAQAQADMAEAQTLIQRGQNALNAATQLFIAHDAVVQALTALLKGPEDAKPDPAPALNP